MRGAVDAFGVGCVVEHLVVVVLLLRVLGRYLVRVDNNVMRRG